MPTSEGLHIWTPSAPLFSLAKSVFTRARDLVYRCLRDFASDLRPQKNSQGLARTCCVAICLFALTNEAVSAQFGPFIYLHIKKADFQVTQRRIIFSETTSSVKIFYELSFTVCVWNTRTFGLFFFFWLAYFHLFVPTLVCAVLSPWQLLISGRQDQNS